MELSINDKRASAVWGYKQGEREMATKNFVELIGYVGDDPKTGTTPGGTAWANLRLATTDRWKTKDGEQREETQWHTVVVYRNLAEVVGKYVKKGAHLLIEGKLKYRKWEDAEGDVHYFTEIELASFQFLDKKKDEQEKVEKAAEAEKAKKPKKPKAAPMGPVIDEGDIPF
jgi:single-strand DNA-binding protein